MGHGSCSHYLPRCSPSSGRARQRCFVLTIAANEEGLTGSYGDARDTQLFGELAGAVAGERTGEEVAHFGGLGVQQPGQRGRIVAVAGQRRLQFVDGTRQHLLDHLGGHAPLAPPECGVVQNRLFSGYTGAWKPPAHAGRFEIEGCPAGRRRASSVQARRGWSGPRPSSVSQCGWPWPVINCRGLLPVRSARRLRVKQRWFKKNCGNSKYEPPKWRRRVK